jgi:hypothetical protein
VNKFGQLHQTVSHKKALAFWRILLYSFLSFSSTLAKYKEKSQNKVGIHCIKQVAEKKFLGIIIFSCAIRKEESFSLKRLR